MNDEVKDFDLINFMRKNPPIKTPQQIKIDEIVNKHCEKIEANVEEFGHLVKKITIGRNYYFLLYYKPSVKCFYYLKYYKGKLVDIVKTTSLKELIKKALRRIFFKKITKKDKNFSYINKQNEVVYTYNALYSEELDRLLKIRFI